MGKAGKGLKVVVIGAGSYVFGPSMLNQALAENRLADTELALVDVDRDAVELMAGVGRRMAATLGLETRIAAHSDRRAALDGASFVLCSAARELRKRFLTDCEIMDRYLPNHWAGESGSVTGISYSLRQIALIQQIAEDMKKLCPHAWLLNVCNPLPRVCQAAHEEGIKTAGFCAVSLEGRAMAWRLLRGERLSYPFAQARERWTTTMAGLNHFSWLLDIRDRATGEDLMPMLRQSVQNGATSGNPRSEQMCRETGYLLLPSDHHTRDFLEPQGPLPPRSVPAHGTPEERQRRFNLLRAVADGRESWSELTKHPSWERPTDFVAAMASGRSVFFHALNLFNRGQMPDLPSNVVVETPCEVSSNGPVPRAVELPSTVQPYCRRAALVADMIVRAARERKRALVEKAVELDPTIADKHAGVQAIRACLQAHADILPKYD